MKLTPISLKKWINGISLFCTFSLTAALGIFAWQKQKIYENTAIEETQLALQKSILIIQQSLEGFIHGLQGIGGVYAVLDFQPTLKNIENYAKSRDFFRNFKGALGFGFIRYISSEGTHGASPGASKC